MLIHTDNERDPGMPDDLRDYVNALNGKRRKLHMSSDQAAKAAYIVAMRRPCYVCASKPPYVIGKLRLERIGQWFLYGICESCLKERSPEEVKHLATLLVEEDLKDGIPVAKPKLHEERGL